MNNIFLAFAFFGLLLPQDHLDSLIQDVLGGATDSARLYLPAIEVNYPNNSSVMFLKGLLESDGDKAMDIFRNIYNTHPSSEYGDDAVMKVAEYYYAAGLYVQAAEWLKKMPLYYSRSDHIERAIKLFLNSLIVSGNRDTAVFYSKVFHRQFPALDVDGKINNLLMDYEQSQQREKEKSKIRSQKLPAVFQARKSSFFRGRSPLRARFSKPDTFYA